MMTPRLDCRSTHKWMVKATAKLRKTLQLLSEETKKKFNLFRQQSDTSDQLISRMYGTLVQPPPTPHPPPISYSYGNGLFMI